MTQSSPGSKQYVRVNGKNMAYLEMGSGDPIVFQHGNPTSSFLWRNIMPHLASQGRCIAIDLIGMGDSDKLDDSGADSYSLVQHQEYLDEALAQLGVKSDVTWVIHDWGSALGFDWSRRHPECVKGLCYMEAIVRPVTWDEWPEAAAPIFRSFRSADGEELILQRNLFVERVLPGSIIRTLSDEEMEEYRRPFINSGEDRRPTLSWPRQIPIGGEPEEVVLIVTAYAKWLQTTKIPKLFINADPGAILIGSQREFCRAFPNQEEITVNGIHFLQEDSADDIGKAISDWVARL